MIGVAFAVERADRQDGEGGSHALGHRLVEPLGGGHLHRLHLGHDLALHVAGDDAHGGNEAHDGTEPGGLAVHGRIARGDVRGVAAALASRRMRYIATPMMTAAPVM